jgi:hypothetical protein
MSAVFKNGQLQYQPDDNFMRALAQFAADVGGSVAKAAGATAIVGGTTAVIAGAGSAGTAVAGVGAVALVTTAAMEEEGTPSVIKHRTPDAIPDEGITLQISDAGGQHDNPYGHATNSVSKQLALEALAGEAMTERAIDGTYANFRNLLPVMKSMGIELENCEIGEATQHGCAKQNRVRTRDFSPAH